MLLIFPSTALLVLSPFEPFPYIQIFQWLFYKYLLAHDPREPVTIQCQWSIGLLVRWSSGLLVQLGVEVNYEKADISLQNAYLQWCFESHCFSPVSINAKY